MGKDLRGSYSWEQELVEQYIDLEKTKERISKEGEDERNDIYRVFFRKSHLITDKFFDIEEIIEEEEKRVTETLNAYELTTHDLLEKILRPKLEERVLVLQKK